MAEKVIFAEQTITGFELNSSYSCYLKSVRPSPFVLEDGKTYRITWDDDTDEYQAVTANVGGMDFVCVGNGAVIGGENNGKKFAVGYNTATGFMNFFALEAGESHRVAVYQIVDDEESETGSTIVLRDRNGNPVEYPGIERVKLNTADGGTAEFVDSALFPESVEKTIDPDFSGGNIVETPETGTMFSKFTVNKPATLAPQYIAEGVNIAGIVGTLSAGGGSNVLIKQVTFASNASGTITLATAEELSTVGFDPINNKCFIAIVPQSYIGTTKSSPGVMVGALVVKHSLYSNTTDYYGMLLTGYYSSYKTIPNYKVITNNPFSGTLVTDTPCYVDGNIVYDATNSTVKLDNDTFFILAGNLTPTV